ncbi:hypothetical protein QY97_00508 [Bacillus thermotolerans]|uniref:Uncharacterized protein n=1 Tax=Bacillus thermotolerans TaxID=1221996 RepID=A0A0F5I4V7_BACTR|nr:hypothetical protein QY97_00508 [Bacillus thermotolerans]KKB40162.1 hypothetical protein QY95_01795 [Bacillus thermotolerans]
MSSLYKYPLPNIENMKKVEWKENEPGLSNEVSVHMYI